MKNQATAVNTNIASHATTCIKYRLNAKGKHGYTPYAASTATCRRVVNV